MEGGWIKLHRKFLKWEWYDDINVCRIFVHLLLIANHENKKWQGKTILRGQVLTSLTHLAKETKLTIRSVRTALNKLKSTNEIEIKSTSKYTLITIEKYNDYQANEEKNDILNDTQIDKQTTNERQTNDKQTTTNKNIKNIKNDKNNNNNNIDDGCVDGLQNVNDSCIDGLQKVIEFYNSNIGVVTPYGLEVLEDYTKEIGKDLVIYAMQISVEANKRNVKYIKAILNNWQKAGIKTLIEAKADNEQFKNKNVMPSKKKDYQNCEQREYKDLSFLYANNQKGE